jgi:hypothetical protein
MIQEEEPDERERVEVERERVVVGFFAAVERDRDAAGFLAAVEREAAGFFAAVEREAAGLRAAVDRDAAGLRAGVERRDGELLPGTSSAATRRARLSISPRRLFRSAPMSREVTSSRSRPTVLAISSTVFFLAFLAMARV